MAELWSHSVHRLKKEKGRKDDYGIEGEHEEREGKERGTRREKRKERREGHRDGGENKGNWVERSEGRKGG